MNHERDIEFHLKEIDAWRAGWRASPGSPLYAADYAERRLVGIAHHERRLFYLGHKPTIERIKQHGFADGLGSKDRK